MTATTKTRPNTYAGTCSGCGGHVAAQVGVLGNKVDGRWTVRHTSCKPTSTSTVTRKSARSRYYVNDVTTCFACRRSGGQCRQCSLVDGDW